MQILRSYWRSAAWLVLGLAMLGAVGPLQLTDRYQTFVIATVAIYSIVTLSVGTLAGLAGIWSVGHLAFVAIGAFATAYFSQHGVSLPLIILFSMVSSGAIGFLMGMAAGRFEVLYLAILTLALALVAGEVIGRWTTVTGGDQGTPVNPFKIFGQFLTPQNVTELAIAAAALAAILVDIVAHGRWGRRWLAIKNQRLAGVAIGLNPLAENATAFGLSAALASVAGVLLSLLLGYISGDAFTLTNAINFIIAAVIGGVGSIPGAVLGTTFIVVLPEVLRGVPTDFQVIVFGAVMIVVLLFVPEGIVPGLYRRGERLLRRRSRRAAPPPAAITTAKGPGMRLVTRGAAGGGADLLVAESVTVRFGGLVALSEVGLRVGAGEVVALIGPNGAGKTTFLNVLGGFVRPAAGAALRLHSRDMLRMSARARPRAGLARTFQHAELFSELTVLETVTLAARLPRAHRPGESATARARNLLNQLGLWKYAGSLPGELPFGIQKRVDIARALALDPGLIVMDEPFSGLDVKEQDELHDLILSLKADGTAVLLVDHAVLQVLSLVDRVYVLDYGRIIASGLPDEIRVNEEVRTAYFGTTPLGA